MQREYKYRAKRLDNGKWVIGFLVKMWGGWHIIDWDDENTAYPIHTDTIGQYTGMKDINGKDIYDGDRVEYITDIINYIPFKERGVVEYQSDIAMFILNVEADTIPLSYCRRGVQVIGNIYDNYELIKA